MQPVRSDSWGATLVNVLGVVLAVGVYLFLAGWGATLQEEMWGPGPISGTFRVYGASLLTLLTAAAVAGLGLGVLLRTGRPAIYAGLLSAGLLLNSGLTTTIHQFVWWDVLWIGFLMLLPAVTAGVVAFWMARRRRGAPQPPDSSARVVAVP